VPWSKAYATPKEMSESDLQHVQDAFVAATNRCAHTCLVTLSPGGSTSSSPFSGSTGLWHSPAPWNTIQAPRSRLSFPSSSKSGPGLAFVRSYSATQSQVEEEANKSKWKASELSPDQYRTLSDSAMDDLFVFLEDVMETDGNAENGWEVEYDSGVMTIHFGSNHGTYVLNKQPPTKQIWLSSPLSGPKRYDYDEDARHWFYARDGQSLGSLLSQEFSHILERVVSVPID